MKYRDFLETDMYKEVDIVYFVNEDGQELDLTDENCFEMEVLQVNKSKCTGVVEIMLRTN